MLPRALIARVASVDRGPAAVAGPEANIIAVASDYSSRTVRCSLLQNLCCTMSGNKTNLKLNFSAEEDEKLIEAVAIHPAIYDLQHSMYKDQGAKDNVWIEIATIVERSGEWVF